MSAIGFEQTLRTLIRHQPFQPFEVELLNGERFTVDRPDALALNGGYAGFIAEDGSIHFFNSNNIRHLGDEDNGARV